MADLLPCPNKECRSHRPLHVAAILRTFNVSCGCGVSGPHAGNVEDAVAAWNALPRQPQWTEYDGTEATLPPGGTIVILKHYTRTCVAKFIESWTNEMDSLWAIQLNFSEDLESVAIGDKWWPLPGGGE